MSGTELAFFQESAVKHQALGKPTPQIMTMTHENAALSAACGETMMTRRPVGHGLPRRVRPDQRRRRHPQRRPRSLSGADHVRLSAVGRERQRAGRAQLVHPVVPADPRPGRAGAPVHALGPQAGRVRQPGHVVSRAVQVMPSEPQGPAYLAIPREVAMLRMEAPRFPLAEHLRPTSTPVADPADCARPRSGCSRPSSRSSASRAWATTRRRRPRSRLAETLGANVMADGFRMNMPSVHPLHRGRLASPPRRPTPTACSSSTCSCPGSHAPSIPARDARHHAGHRSDPSDDDDLRVPDGPGDQRRPGQAIPALLEELRSQMTRRAEAPLRGAAGALPGRGPAAARRRRRDGERRPGQGPRLAAGSATRSARRSIPRRSSRTSWSTRRGSIARGRARCWARAARASAGPRPPPSA